MSNYAGSSSSNADGKTESDSESSKTQTSGSEPPLTVTNRSKKADIPTTVTVAPPSSNPSPDPSQPAPEPCRTCYTLSLWLFILTCTQILSIIAIIYLNRNIHNCSIAFDYNMNLASPLYVVVQEECFNRMHDPERYKNDVKWNGFCDSAFAFRWPRGNGILANSTNHADMSATNLKSGTIATSWNAAGPFHFGGWF